MIIEVQLFLEFAPTQVEVELCCSISTLRKSCLLQACLCISDKSLQDKPGRTVSHDQPALHETTTARASLRKQVVNNPLHLSPWKLFQSWVTAEQLYTVDSLQSDAMIRILHAMSTQKIERVLVGYKGTQLKATFILAESQKVVFKPMRQGVC